jgi:hypothetical protein
MLLNPGTNGRILENTVVLFGSKLVLKEPRYANITARDRALEQGNGHEGSVRRILGRF